MKKRIIGIGIGILILLIFIKWSNLISHLGLFKQVSLYSLGVGSLFIILHIYLKSLRYFFLLRHFHVKVSFIFNIFVHMVTPILSRFSPGKIGDSFKVLLFKKDKKILSFCYIFERILDIFSLLVISTLFLIISKKYILYLFLGALIFICLLLFLIFGNFEIILNYLLKKDILEKNWFKKNLASFPKHRLVTYALFSIIIFSLFYLGIYIIANNFMRGINILFFSSIYALSQLVGIISAIPGGIGAREITFTYLAEELLRIPKETGGVISIVILLITLVIETLMAVIALLIFWLFKIKKHTQNIKNNKFTRLVS